LLDDDVLALDIAQLAESLPEGTGKVGSRGDNADPVNLPRLLRFGTERRGEEAASQGADECPPIHYSIT
jgi:hypothetical protein